VSKKALIIWFNDKGDMLEQALPTYYQRNPTYAQYKSEEAKDFDDQMEFVKIHDWAHGNARAVFKSTVTGREYSMYIQEFNKLLEEKKLIDLRIEGTFSYLKRGSGQAIKLI
jgi:hypothetical protein